MGGTTFTGGAYPALRSAHPAVHLDPPDHPRDGAPALRGARAPRTLPRRQVPAAGGRDGGEGPLPQALVPEALDGGDGAPEPRARERAPKDADGGDEPGSGPRAEGDVEADLAGA